ncbi:thiamine diphosphokinase [Hathewaya limosa]|uniref:Thiamine diphosphokinase n=1 Tax=Hathewaya limosa TaxID=1536 RepID=A0ABU0JPI3_HATLI|nr:thiamine diphosphokinase [Hathewaya limosa]AWZ48715.1 thiamine diphosphokinase [Clostridiaceae bacterium 14S0207]MDQ0479000.1 thiamine pyrophosphokinase [Hathewaya limosa]
MKGIIISGGTEPSLELLKDNLKGKYVLIASDSGANVTYKYGLCPSIIVGDLDSIKESVKEYYSNQGCKFIKFNPEKDFTDTELAIKEITKKNIDEIILLGCTGTRLDHVLANLGLLIDYHKKGYKIKLVDDNNEVKVCEKSLSIKGEKGKLFSVQAFKETVSNLSIRGAKYELENYNLEPGSPLTVSNEFLNDKDIKITFNSGNLLLIYPKD